MKIHVIIQKNTSPFNGKKNVFVNNYKINKNLHLF